jgi:hypothetical protein
LWQIANVGITALKLGSFKSHPRDSNDTAKKAPLRGTQEKQKNTYSLYYYSISSDSF